jgi:hypothetical protein
MGPPGFLLKVKAEPVLAFPCGIHIPGSSGARLLWELPPQKQKPYAFVEGTVAKEAVPCYAAKTEDMAAISAADQLHLYAMSAHTCRYGV